jgi:hypothetical protein
LLVGPGVNYIVIGERVMATKEKYDGRSRPSNKAYEESWNRIFGSNPVAKEVRTPKFKSQVVESKKVYNRKRLNND